VRRVLRLVLYGALALVLLVIAATSRNNSALLSKLLVAAFLIGVILATVNATAGRGIVMRMVGGLFVMVICLSLIGHGCAGTVGDPARYVALGDSYSSGEGAKAAGYPYDNELEYGPGATNWTDDRQCHRSVRAYPGHLRTEVGNTSMLFTACSGARIDDVRTHRQHPRTPPQEQSMRSWRQQGPPDLVTISIGGNDLGFAHILTVCTVGRCAPGDPQGIAATFDRALDDLPRRLAETYGEIRSIAGADVPLLVIGYPQILPAAQGCLATAGLDTAERAMLRDETRRSNEAIRSAAILAGAFYVDTLDAFDDHLICSHEPFANGLVVPGADTVMTEGDYLTGAFHPTPAGHVCITRTILAQHPSPTQLDPPPLGGSLPEQPAVGSSAPCPS
jgi:lysophospholipase L1-like esterase